jgi:hypothetical protein
MVKLTTPCPRCRATVCQCGYAAEQKRRRLEEQRRRRPYDHGERTLHAAIIASWVERSGWWCPGAPDLGHKAHYVKPGQLDVDDVVPVSRGGARRDVENKRVLCRTANRGRRT